MKNPAEVLETHEHYIFHDIDLTPSLVISLEEGQTIVSWQNTLCSL